MPANWSHFYSLANPKNRRLAVIEISSLRATWALEDKKLARVNFDVILEFMKVA